MFQALAGPEYGCTAVYGGNRLSVKPNTQLVVAIPSSLMSYDLHRLLRGVQVVCVDEADILLVGGERRATWGVLEAMRTLYQRDRGRERGRGGGEGRGREGGGGGGGGGIKLEGGGLKGERGGGRVEDEEGIERVENEERERVKGGGMMEGDGGNIDRLPFRQFLFTAATLPHGGPQTAGSLLVSWLPRHTLFITTDHAHQLVRTAQNRFINIGDETTPTNCEATPTHSETTPTTALTQLKLQQLINDLCDLGGSSCHGDSGGILVFANTVSSAEKVYTFLEVEGGRAAMPPWWAGQVGRLHKEVPADEREELVRRFKGRDVRVLVCTDVASRGLDLVEVGAVIQFDFPGNSAHFLHRAGRTARAGKEGKGQIILMSPKPYSGTYTTV